MQQTLIVGLGNPGEQYATTRHNAGFLFVDYVAQQQNLTFTTSPKTNCLVAENAAFLLLKPQLFMNRSGEALQSYLRFFKKTLANFSACIVVYDDLDLQLGNWKLVYGSGPKAHNGVNSVVSSLGTDLFWHGRIGVDNRIEGLRIPGEQYVLQPISAAEESLFTTIFGQLYAQVLSIQAPTK